MKKELLFSLIKEHGQITDDQSQDLLDLVNNYPFFHTAHLLLLYNLKKSNTELYNQQLRKSAIYVPDRSILFNFINDFDKEPEPAKMQELQKIDKEQSFEETKISKAQNEPADAQSELLEIDDNHKEEENDEARVVEFSVPPEKSDTSISQVPDFELEEEPVHSSDTFHLIEKFIEENPAFVPNRLELSETRDDISLHSIVENEDLVTETLAIVYTKQKLYGKAISIYEKLILKFPEKSAYFATRIEELRNNIK